MCGGGGRPDAKRDPWKPSMQRVGERHVMVLSKGAKIAKMTVWERGYCETGRKTLKKGRSRSSANEELRRRKQEEAPTYKTYAGDGEVTGGIFTLGEDRKAVRSPHLGKGYEKI